MTGGWFARSRTSVARSSLEASAPASSMVRSERVVNRSTRRSSSVAATASSLAARRYANATSSAPLRNDPSVTAMTSVPSSATAFGQMRWWRIVAGEPAGEGQRAPVPSSEFLSTPTVVSPSRRRALRSPACMRRPLPRSSAKRGRSIGGLSFSARSSTTMSSTRTKSPACSFARAASMLMRERSTSRLACLYSTTWR